MIENNKISIETLSNFFKDQRVWLNNKNFFINIKIYSRIIKLYTDFD